MVSQCNGKLLKLMVKSSTSLVIFGDRISFVTTAFLEVHERKVLLKCTPHGGTVRENSFSPSTVFILDDIFQNRCRHATCNLG